MRKITCAMLMVAGLGASAAALADDAPTQIQAGIAITSGTGGQCSLLTEDVTISLSKNVYGGYNCKTTDNSIRVAVCHSAGSLKATNLDCAVVGYDSTGLPIYNDGGCTSANPGSTYPMPGGNARVYETMSKGGTVAPANLGSVCSTSAQNLTAAILQ